MRFKTLNLVFALSALAFSGCSMSPEDKVAREQALKQTVDSFSDSVVQTHWDEAYKLTDGNFDSSDKLKSNLMVSWVPDSTLTGGQITSMAWVTDTIAKVKMTWSFQSGSVESYSSETFVWIWNGSAWKFRGRSLR